jgi:hypothetical protein
MAGESGTGAWAEAPCARKVHPNRSANKQALEGEKNDCVVGLAKIFITPKG